MTKTRNAAVEPTAASPKIVRVPIILNSDTNRTKVPSSPIDLGLIPTFPKTFKQVDSALPQELIDQPRWFEVGDDKVAHFSWNKSSSQRPFQEVPGNKGFDISGHDVHPDYLVMDWDNVYNPTRGEWVSEFARNTFNWIISELPETYVESSVSRKGFHIVLRPTDLDKITSSGKTVIQFGEKSKLEMFYKNKSKCVVFTGYRISKSSEIASGNAVDSFVRRLMGEIRLFNHVDESENSDESPAFTPKQDRVRAAEMLKYIPVAQLSRSDWRVVIRCWKDLELPFETIDQWSQEDTRYNDGKDATCQQTWDDMEPGDPTVAIKTLCNWAERYGGYNSIHHMDQKLWYQFNISNKVAHLNSITYAIQTKSTAEVRELAIGVINSFLDSEEQEITDDLMCAVGFCTQFQDSNISMLISRVKTICKKMGIPVPDFNAQVKRCVEQISLVQSEIERKQRTSAAHSELEELGITAPIDLSQVVYPDNLVPNWRNHTLEKVTPHGPVTVFNSVMIVTEKLVETQTGIQSITVASLRQGSKKWEYITASRDMFVSNTRILALAKQGLAVRSKSAGEVVEYIGQFEELNSHLIPSKVLVYQPGWHGDEFVFPSYPSTKYTLDPETSSRLQQVFSSAGDRTKVIPFIRRIKSTATADVALGAMLSAPLVREVLYIDNVQVHLYGGAGSGKSALYKLIYSLIGNPFNVAAIPSANATPSGIEFHFADHRDLPAIIEDTNTIIDDAARVIINQLIMGFGNDTGKLRATKEYGLGRLYELRGSLLTNAEKLMTQYNSNGGSKRRVMELLVPPDLISDAFAEEFNSVIRSNHGGFLEDWIAYIQNHKESIRQMYRTVLEKYKKMAPGRVPRQLQSMAAITTANVLFDHLFLYPDWTLEHCMGTELAILSPVVLQLPSKHEISDVERVKILVREWIQQNRLKFVEPREYEQTDCYGIQTQKYIAIDPQVFKNLLNEHGFPTETIIQQLQVDGFVVKGDGNNMFTQIKLPSNKKIRMTKIMLEQLE